MHFVKDVFQKNNSEHAHEKFVRYSKGEFVGPLLKVKFAKANIKISASFHYVDELLILLAKYLDHKIVHINGSLVWNQDLSADLLKLGIKYSKVTKSRGIFKYVLDNDVDFKAFVESMGKYNILATIKGEDYSFVTKSSFPKPNKEFGSDFVKVTLPGNFAKIVQEEFLFDIKGAVKDAEISHRITIKDIHLPKDTSDFEVARRLATREGLLTRKTIVDGKEVDSKIEFNI